MIARLQDTNYICDAPVTYNKNIHILAIYVLSVDVHACTYVEKYCQTEIKLKSSFIHTAQTLI